MEIENQKTMYKEKTVCAIAAVRDLLPEPHAYWIETYGCQMNVRDSETLSGFLADAGYSKAVCREDADFILFNTCCVRDHAEKRVYGNIGALKPLKDAKPSLVIAVSGCMMQQEGVGAHVMKRFPYVNLVFGTHVLPHFPEMLHAVLRGERVLAVSTDEEGVTEGLPSGRPSGVSAFVNINFGCNNFCTYCIVPHVRGRERSRKPEDIVAECKCLADQGFSEVTLLGQNVNSYGQDLENCDFADLLTRVSEIENLRRVRFMTSHPKDLTPRLIDAIAALPKVCHHVHLPLQSGSDRILRLMNRKYTRDQYLATVAMLRARIPDVEITTDIIVGFPDEQDADFQDTLSLVEDVGFATAFTFKYSPRKGTVAAAMEQQISDTVKRERLKILNALQERKTRENNEKYVGYVGTVLVEGTDDRSGAMLYGKYANFKMVYFPGNPDLIGRYVRVRALKVRGNSLSGEMEEAL